MSAAPETPPEVPEGVLVQSIAIDEHGREAGYRIHADGRYESLWDGHWKEGKTLTPAQLAAVRHAIESVPLGDLAGRYENPGDPQVLWMQVLQRRRDPDRVGRRQPPRARARAHTALLTDAFR